MNIRKWLLVAALLTLMLFFIVLFAPLPDEEPTTMVTPTVAQDGYLSCSDYLEIYQAYLGEGLTHEEAIETIGLITGYGARYVEAVVTACSS